MAIDVFVLVKTKTSTNTSIAAFNYGRNQIDESVRALNKRNYEPFCELVYCDKLRSIEYENELKSFLNLQNRSELHTFLKNRKPNNTILYFGRLLWAAYHEASIAKYLDDKDCEESHIFSVYTHLRNNTQQNNHYNLIIYLIIYKTSS